VPTASFFFFFCFNSLWALIVFDNFGKQEISCPAGKLLTGENGERG
jgi:hypothetical protein